MNKAQTGLYFLGLGLLLRLLYCLWVHPPSQFIFSDMLQNAYSARDIFLGSSDPDVTLRHGAFTYLLSFTFRNKPGWNWNLLMFIFSSLSLLMTWWLARRLLSPRLANVAILYQSVNFLDIDSAGYLLDTALFTFCLQALLAGLLIYDSASKPARWAAITGVLFSFSLLTRENILISWPLVVLWMLLGRHRWRWRHVILMCLVQLAVVAPMMVRNYHLTGHPYLATTRAGFNLYYFNRFTEVLEMTPPGKLVVAKSPLFDGPQEMPWCDPRVWLKPPTVVESVHDDHSPSDVPYWRAQASAFLWEHPHLLLYKSYQLIYILLVPPWPGAWAGGTSMALSYGFNLVFCLTIVPLYLRQLRSSLRSDRPRQLLNLMVASLVVSVLMSLGESRYRLPFDPLILLCALRSFETENRDASCD